MTHTPWTLEPSGSTDAWDKDDYIVRNSEGGIVFLDTAYYPAAPDTEDAAFIVKAVNSHDKLVEALRAIAAHVPSSQHNNNLNDLIANASVKVAIMALNDLEGLE